MRRPRGLLLPSPLLPSPTARPISRNLRLLYVYNAFAYAYAYVPVAYYFFCVDHLLPFAAYSGLRSIYYAAVVLAQIPTGLLSDRLGRKAVLVAAPIAQALGALVIASSSGFAGFAAGEALLGVGQALLASAASAALFDTLRDLGRETDYFRVEARATVARLLGTSGAFLLGGALSRWFGNHFPYLATAAVTTVAALAALLLREPRSAAAGKASGTLAILSASVRTVLRDGRVRWLVLYYAALFVWLRLAFYTYQPKLEEIGRRDPLAIGALFASLNVAAALVSRFAHRIVARLGERATLYGMQAVLIGTFVFLGRSRWSLAFLAFFLQQAPFGLHFPVLYNATNRLVPSERRGTILSLQSMVGRLAFAGYFALFGAWVDAHDLASAYLLSAGLGAGALLVLGASRPREEGDVIRSRSSSPP
jgi:predicted MFS family arabinose efflux permease